jgi:hypothetical protein
MAAPTSTAPALTVVQNDLIKVLDPAVATTRASYSRMRRPWTPGYSAKAVSPGAGVLTGVNSYHPNDAAHVNLLQGVGAAAGAAVPTYDLPVGSTLVLPTTTPLTTGLAYLDAICMIYAPGDRNNAILLERVATGGADITRPFWRINDANTFAIAAGYAAGPLYDDVPAGWTIEIQVPDAAGTTYGPSVMVTLAADLPQVVAVRDFMASTTAAIALNRIFR